MATEYQGRSPKAKENLQRNAELREKDNKFVKLSQAKRKSVNLILRK